MKNKWKITAIVLIVLYVLTTFWLLASKGAIIIESTMDYNVLVEEYNDLSEDYNFLSDEYSKCYVLVEDLMLELETQGYKIFK